LSVILPFKFDGSTFKFGNVSFAVPEHAQVKGFNFKVPSKFALLILSGVEGSWKLLEDVARAPLREEVKTKLLEEAVSEGIEKAGATLQAYIRDAPNGKPRFYREYTQSDYFHIHLTGGQACLEFSFTGDVEPFARRLPPNVYCECERAGFTLNLKRFRQASAEIEEFFSFAVRLKKASPYVARRTYKNCFEEYFRDKNEAYRLLAKIEKDAGHRAEREQLYERLKREKALACKGGFLVYGWPGMYYVMEDGRVYKLDYEDRVDEKEAILRLFKKGVTPKKLVEIRDTPELSEVAKAVGKLRPELVPIILP